MWIKINLYLFIFSNFTHLLKAMMEQKVSAFLFVLSMEKFGYSNLEMSLNLKE